MRPLEVNFDGLVGPSHNYAGLARGNLASTSHHGMVSNPRAAALEGLRKMRLLLSLGVPQAVLPPHPRPNLRWLRRLGFQGPPTEVLTRVQQTDPRLLAACYSASSMWTANAATVCASQDAHDNRVHFTPANLTSLLHRHQEAKTTTHLLRAIFSDGRHFVVHDPLPGPHFADEGAANHTRLEVVNGASLSVVHLFAWGRTSHQAVVSPKRYPARQTLQASQAVARLHRLRIPALFWQQCPTGIDAGAFHTEHMAPAVTEVHSATGSLTASGYPRTVRRWRRGTDLLDAPTVFEGEAPGEKQLSMETAPEGYELAVDQVIPADVTSLEVPLQVETGSEECPECGINRHG